MYDRDRRSQRVTLPEPQQARVGRQPAFVVDVSLGGFGVAQQVDTTSAIGQPRRVSFEWNGRNATFVCELRWLRSHQRLGSGSFTRSVYHAGYQVVHGTAEGYDILRDILREYSARS
ncbi:MAG TPA: hypothetical protein VLU46_04980 [Thermoanaerobaculia bacterium]|nr:hypothetical protein [Thermoanaerobaculia bacterium]